MHDHHGIGMDPFSLHLLGNQPLHTDQPIFVLHETTPHPIPKTECDFDDNVYYDGIHIGNSELM